MLVPGLIAADAALAAPAPAPRLPPRPHGSTLQAGGPLGSSLACHWLFDQYPEMHCSGANLALDLAKFQVGGGVGRG